MEKNQENTSAVRVNKSKDKRVATHILTVWQTQISNPVSKSNHEFMWADGINVFQTVSIKKDNQNGLQIHRHNERYDHVTMLIWSDFLLEGKFYQILDDSKLEFFNDHLFDNTKAMHFRQSSLQNVATYLKDMPGF